MQINQLIKMKSNAQGYLFCTLVLSFFAENVHQTHGKPMQRRPLSQHELEYNMLHDTGKIDRLDSPRIHQETIPRMHQHIIPKMQQRQYTRGHTLKETDKVLYSILNDFHVSDFVDYIVKHAKQFLAHVSDFECDACKVAVSVVQVMFATNKSEAEISKVLVELCIKFKIESEKVCHSVIPEFKNEVLTVIDKIALSPKEICGLILGGSCATPFNPLTNWTVPLPKTPKPPVVQPKDPQPGAPKLRVLQLSDIHFDPQYMHKGNAGCDEPLCCRINSEGKHFRPAGFWGDYNNCDTPLWTLENMFHNLAAQKFDYILWTGDLPPHDVWNQSRSDQVTKLDLIHQMFLKYFPSTPVYPALGNHESSPVNSFPPPFITGNNSIEWLYGELAKTWSSWLPSDTMANINKGGYYTVLIKKGLRLVSMNMNISL